MKIVWTQMCFCDQKVYDYIIQGKLLEARKVEFKNYNVKVGGHKICNVWHRARSPIKLPFLWFLGSYVVFGTRKSTILLTFKLLEMWCLPIWMPKNVIIPMFGLIENLIRFLQMWDYNIWFIPRNLKWILYFFLILSLDL